MEKKPIPFILLDSSLLTNGVRVLVDGVDTTQFERNPVMFYRHDDWCLPIGRWENIRKESGQLLADAVFDYDDQDKEVQRLIGKVERGFVKMASAGLVDLAASYDQVYLIDGQDGPTVIKSRIREASIVSIGANNNAFRLYDHDDKVIDLSGDVKLLLNDFIVQQTLITMTKKTLNSILNLADDATQDAQITATELLLSEKTAAEARATAAEAKVTEMENAQKEALRAQSLSLVDAAIADGRILAAAKESYLLLFDKDFESASKVLSSIPVRRTVREQIQGGATGNDLELADLEKKSWDELDKAGKLSTVKNKYPELYESKFKERFEK